MRTVPSILALVLAALPACVGDEPSIARDPHDDASTPVGDAATDTGSPVTSDASTDANDASATVDAADAGPVWTPDALGSRVAVWLDGSRGVTSSNGRVSVWADQSSHANSASQATLANQPQIGAIHGKPAIKFDGAATILSIADAASLHWGTGQFLIAIVVQCTNNPANGNQNGYAALWSKALAPYPYEGVQIWANSPATAKPTFRGELRSSASGTGGGLESLVSGVNDGTPRVVGLRRLSPTELQIRVNGAPSGTATLDMAYSEDATGSPVRIGGNGVNQWVLGEIGEIVAVSGLVSDEDAAMLETYLKSKYAIP
jgi:hypothetical protein